MIEGLLSPRGTRSVPSIPIPIHFPFVGDSPFMGWFTVYWRAGACSPFGSVFKGSLVVFSFWGGPVSAGSFLRSEIERLVVGLQLQVDVATTHMFNWAATNTVSDSRQYTSHHYVIHKSSCSLLSVPTAYKTKRTRKDDLSLPTTSLPDNRS